VSLPDVHPQSQEAQPAKVSRVETAQRAGEVFRREVNSPRYRLSLKLVLAGMAVALIYTFILAMANEVFWNGWIGALQPVTDAVGRIVPSVRYLATELVKHGYPARAPYVSHVVAMQWLILASCFLAAALSMAVREERARLRRGFAAARAERERLRPNATLSADSGLAHFLLTMLLLVLPFLPKSRIVGRYAYDVATGYEGLFVFLLEGAAWWCVAFYLSLRLLALLGHDERRNLPVGSSS
jgi:hypothetical protein